MSNKKYSELAPERFYIFTSKTGEAEVFAGRLVKKQGFGKVAIEITQPNRRTETKTDIAVKNYTVREVTREAAYDQTVSQLAQ